MRGFLARLLVTALALWVADYLVAGITVSNLGTLVVAAVIFGIANALVRPILVLLTLPITVLTLGFFLLVVNGMVLGITAWLVPGFAIAGLWPATIGALIVSVVGWFASSFISDTGRIGRVPQGVDVTGRRVG